jgi:hypothetical protein
VKQAKAWDEGVYYIDPSPHLIPKCPLRKNRDEAAEPHLTRTEGTQSMKHFTILNREQLVAAVRIATGALMQHHAG